MVERLEALIGLLGCIWHFFTLGKVQQSCVLIFLERFCMRLSVIVIIKKSFEMQNVIKHDGESGSSGISTSEVKCKEIFSLVNASLGLYPLM